MRLLVVDDDADQLELRVLLLARSGFDVISATDVDEALQLAMSGLPSCALIDLRLPNEDDGFRLIRELKALDPNMRLIVLSGSSISRLQSRPESALVEAFFAKPASTSDLIRRLRSLEAAAHG